MSGTRHAWIDASAGVAGDMLLGALIDAGADLVAIQQNVDAVIGESVRLTCEPVTRAGQHANRLSVEVIAEDVPSREWRSIEHLIATAELPGRYASGLWPAFSDWPRRKPKSITFRKITFISTRSEHSTLLPTSSELPRLSMRSRSTALARVPWQSDQDAFQALTAILVCRCPL